MTTYRETTIKPEHRATGRQEPYDLSIYFVNGALRIYILSQAERNKFDHHAFRIAPSRRYEGLTKEAAEQGADIIEDSSGTKNIILKKLNEFLLKSRVPRHSE